jgi:uncharacterized protein RhaS with RHS repeats
VSYAYGSTGASTGAGPHQARSVGGSAYAYDANGNLLSGGGRSYTWSADNLPSSVTSGGVSESYLYDADGERVAKTVSGTPAVTTVYFAGLWEQVVGGASKRYYTVGGQIVAMRDSAGIGAARAARGMVQCQRCYSLCRQGYAHDDRNYDTSTRPARAPAATNL